MEPDKRKVSVLFMFFGILFCVCLITSNVLETKQLSFGPVNLTAGVIVFPVSYILNDVVCEVWGYARTRMLIWMGFAMNFFFVVMGAIADWIPGAPYWHGDEGFHIILRRSTTMRTCSTMISTTTYLIYLIYEQRRGGPAAVRPQDGV